MLFSLIVNIKENKLDIPQFDSIQEFKKFVHRLEDSEIQSFSYDDWIELYEKIDKLFENGNITERLDELKKNFIETGTKSSESVCLPMDASRFFTNCMCGYEFIKLYKNFKLNPLDIEHINNIAKDVGLKLSYEDFDLANILINDKEKKRFTECIDDILLKNTEYEKFYGDLSEMMKSDVKISVIPGTSNTGGTYHLQNNSVILLDQNSDDFISTATHEVSHAQYQQLTPLQIALAKGGVLPKGINPKLHKLFSYNNKFYLTGEIVYYVSTLDNLHSNHRGYSRQPLEHFAFFMGFLTEREYRKQSNQRSERGFIIYNNYLTQTLKVNAPLSASSNKGKITAIYSKDNLNKITKFHKSLPPDLQNKITLSNTGDNVFVTIDMKFCDRLKFRDFCIKEEKKRIRKYNLTTSLLKKIPIVGVGVGIYGAIKRKMLNEPYHMIQNEITSGILSLAVGTGTMFSFAIDALAHYTDIEACKSNAKIKYRDNALCK